jgi:Fe-S cluster assembly iron-binding protein IscA
MFRVQPKQRGKTVLTITPTAAQAVESILSQPEMPDNAGLRIAAEPITDDTGTPRTDVVLNVVSEPEPDDEVIDAGPVYVEPATAELLDEKVLDAELSENQVKFRLREQTEGQSGA